MSKWQEMAAVVNQHPFKSPTELMQQFNKLVIVRLVTANLLVFFLQYEGLMFSTLIFPPSPVWFAAGTACGFIFLRGYRIIPGIWLGSFFAYWYASSGIELAVISATIYILEASSLVFLSYRYLGQSLIFYRKQVFSKFIGLSGLLTAIASFALAYFYHFYHNNMTAITEVWLHWWLANWNGVLIFAFALVAWDTFFPQIYLLKRLPWPIICFLYGLLMLMILGLLFSTTPLTTLCFACAIFPIGMLISIRFSWCGAVSAFFMVGLSLGLAAFLGAPVFSTSFSALTLLFLHIFLNMVTITGLFLAVKKI